MLEIVAFVPARIGVCRTCDEVARAFRIELTEELQEGSDFASLMAALSMLGDVPVRFTSPMSLRGLYLMIKHRTGRIPLVLANGELVHSGPVRNPKELAAKIKSALGD